MLDESKHIWACGKDPPVGHSQQIEPVCLSGPQVPVNAPHAEPGEASVPPSAVHLEGASATVVSRHWGPKPSTKLQQRVAAGVVVVVVDEVLVDVEELVEDEVEEVLVEELVVVEVLVVVVGVSAPEIVSRQLWTSAWIVGLWPQVPALPMPDVSLPSHFA